MLRISIRPCLHGQRLVDGRSCTPQQNKTENKTDGNVEGTMLATPGVGNIMSENKTDGNEIIIFLIKKNLHTVYN